MTIFKMAAAKFTVSRKEAIPYTSSCFITNWSWYHLYLCILGWGIQWCCQKYSLRYIYVWKINKMPKIWKKITYFHNFSFWLVLHASYHPKTLIIFMVSILLLWGYIVCPVFFKYRLWKKGIFYNYYPITPIWLNFHLKRQYCTKFMFITNWRYYYLHLCILGQRIQWCCQKYSMRYINVWKINKM